MTTHTTPAAQRPDPAETLTQAERDQIRENITKEAWERNPLTCRALTLLLNETDAHRDALAKLRELRDEYKTEAERLTAAGLEITAACCDEFWRRLESIITAADRPTTKGE